mgnify:CR=1 FL=1
MKDERLGIAILYNFSKGYEKPVPMELYDIVLPLSIMMHLEKKF